MTDADKYILRQLIAADIDHPSVFVGGPSSDSVRKAIRIVAAILSNYDVTPRAPAAMDAERVRSWRTSAWDSLDRT